MRRKKSFTIIEILITMLIMGTMSATIIPRIGNVREETEKTVRKINETRDFACELDLDDMCTNGGSSSFDNDNSDGVRHNEKAGEIKVCKDGDCITMQDKNVGATSNNINNTNSYGYHFQWGNNHGFGIGCYENGCSDSVKPIDDKAIWDSSYDNHGYNGLDFLVGADDYWAKNNHYHGLWGGANDTQSNNRGYNENNNTVTNVEGRQGPCGNGYHVPSVGEWDKLLEYWAEYRGVSLGEEDGLKYINPSDKSKFLEDFMIPLAGKRFQNNAKFQGLNAAFYLWSSSPNTINDKSYYFSFVPSEGLVHTYQDSRTLGLSVRCFKNRTQEVEK